MYVLLWSHAKRTMHNGQFLVRLIPIGRPTPAYGLVAATTEELRGTHALLTGV